MSSNENITKQQLQELLQQMGYNWDGNGNIDKKIEMATEQQQIKDSVDSLTRARQSTSKWFFGSILTIFGAIMGGGFWVGTIQSRVENNTKEFEIIDDYVQNIQSWVRNNFESKEKANARWITIDGHINHPTLHHNINQKLELLEDEMEETMDYKDRVLELRVTEKVDANKERINEVKADVKDLERKHK